MDQKSISPLDKMQSAIQLAAFHYIACLKAIPTNADHKLIIGDAEYHFDGIRTADNRELHINFQSWAAVSVLRDLIESFSIFLMEIYGRALENNPDGYFSSTSAQFERRGIEGQLSILTKDFQIDLAWISRLTGYNRARNCLAHRAGTVGAPDVTNGNELVVRWLVARATHHDGVVTPTIEAQGPMGSLIRGKHIEGSAVHLSVLDREKRVAVGKMVHFLPDEVLEICQTFQWAAAAFNGLSKPLTRESAKGA